MPTLADIRAQYPEYNDLSDADLARGLYKAHYSDLDFKDFSKRINYMAGANPEEYDPTSKEYQKKYGALSGSSGGYENFQAGVGKSMVDLARGTGQLVGAVSREDVHASRERDAALSGSGAGKAGQIVGAITSTLPALAIPGANTVAGAGAIGAGMGLLQPSTSTRETLTNTALGGALGAAGQYGGQKVAEFASRKLAERAANAATNQSANTVRDAVLKEAREVGYVVPPTAVKPTAVTTALESVSGKAATRQAAESINQRVTNKLIAEDLGLKAGQITQSQIDDVLKTQGKVYEAVKGTGKFASDQQYLDDLAKVSQGLDDLDAAYPGIKSTSSQEVEKLLQSALVGEHSARTAVELNKYLRNQAKTNFKSAFASEGATDKLALARAQSQVADAVEDLIERHLAQAGKGQLADQWRKAREIIAKAHQAEAALAGGNINAIRLAAQLRKGKPMSGGFGTAARFADVFGDVARLDKSGAGVSKLAATVAGGGAGVGFLTGEPITGLLTAAVLSGAPYATRKALLSQVGQRMVNPSYAPGLTGTAALNAARIAGPQGRALGLFAPGLVELEE